MSYGKHPQDENYRSNVSGSVKYQEDGLVLDCIAELEVYNSNLMCYDPLIKSESLITKIPFEAIEFVRLSKPPRPKGLFRKALSLIKKPFTKPEPMKLIIKINGPSVLKVKYSEYIFNYESGELNLELKGRGGSSFDYGTIKHSVNLLVEQLKGHSPPIRVIE